MIPRARHREEALPGFVKPADVIRAALMALRPPRPIGVAETAEAWRVLKNPGGGYSGPWRNSFAPYLVATMDDLTDPECGMSVLITPTQEGKTEIILNLAVHQAAEGGADMLVFQPTRDLALDFAERRLGKAFEATPELRNLIGADRSDDKVLSKLMRNAARITMGWPTSGQMSSRPVPIVVIDERDSMSDDIDGEGDPVDLGVARTKRFGRKAKVLVTSTLKRNDGSGIMARYRQGDRQLLHWQCPHCEDFFTPGFDKARRPTLAHLRIRPDATEDEARREAIMVCPNNGCLIEERHKPALNARAVWLADGATIAADGTIGGNPVRSRIRSRWFTGLVGRGRSWGDLAASYVRARRELELRQDESPLRTWWNTEFGAEYRSVLAGAEALEPEALQARAEPLELRRVPAWAGAVTAAVDVQGNRFDCMAVAWGPDNRSQVVDAWQIFRTKDADGTERLVDPERRAEDWNLLTAEVLQRAWPGEAGTEYRAVTVAVDSGAYTGQAYDWWHRVCRADLHLAKRVMLTKGESRRDVPLVSIRRIEKDRDGKPLKRGIILSLINTEALKDQVDMRLRMTRPGPGWIHLPQSLPDRFWEEATAEAKGPKGWDKVRPRNESFDLLVYNLAAWTRRGGPRIDWNHPPDWARPRAAQTPIEQLAANLAAIAAAADALAPKPIEPKPVPPKPAVPGRSRFWKPSAGPRRLGMGRI
jgi:phage terminase large subunit GpA-like protein